jgi:hypothetical protein
MSEPKWTPGPWEVVEPTAIDYRAPLVYGADRQSLVAGAESGGPIRAVSASEARANARLIAAAPELYQALSALLRHFERKFVGWPATVGEVDARNRTIAALAKARGETP